MLARQSLHSGSTLTIAFSVGCGFSRQCEKINSPRISDLQPLFHKIGVWGWPKLRPNRISYLQLLFPKAPTTDTKSLALLSALGFQPWRSTEAKSFRIRFYENFSAKVLRICIYVSHRGGGVPDLSPELIPRRTSPSFHKHGALAALDDFHLGRKNLVGHPVTCLLKRPPHIPARHRAVRSPL